MVRLLQDAQANATNISAGLLGLEGVGRLLELLDEPWG